MPNLDRRGVERQVAEQVMGWTMTGEHDHTRPQHRPSKDYPGRVIDDYEQKGPHPRLEGPQGERVFFCGCDGGDQIPSYTTDLAAAFSVVERMRARGYEVNIAGPTRPHCWHVRFSKDDDYCENADNLPEAICRAALAASGPR